MASSINDKTIYHIFDICDECLKDNNNGWKVREFLSILIPSLDVKISKKLICNEATFSSLSYFIRLSLIDFVVNENNAFKYISLISKYHKNISNDCLIALFNKVGEKDLNEDLVSTFEELIKEDLNSTAYSIVNRRTDCISKIVGYDMRFVENIKTIFSYADNNYSKVSEWLRLLFNPYAFSPRELVSLFYNNQQLELLEKLFLWFVKHRIDEYELNRYFYEICSFDNSFLVSCTNKLLDCKEQFSGEIFNGLWAREDCNAFADIIFRTMVNDNRHFSFYSLSAEQIFVSEHSKESNEKFLKWAERKIIDITDEKSIKILSNYVSHCSIDLCKNYFNNLIAKKIEIGTFAKILTYTSHYDGWAGSEINAVNAKIKRLEVISSFISDTIDCIEYKNSVEAYISLLRARINKIKIKERLRFDDYF